MRVVYIGDARTIVGVGMLCAGEVYDLADDIAASLIEQGKAELPPAPKPTTTVRVTTTKAEGTRNG
jgi:hypothetical protein